MTETRPKEEKDFLNEVHLREKRKLLVRRKNADNAWFGLGLFGAVGWSVAIPALLGAFAGVWMDKRWPGPPSWTLMLLLIGIIAGCANAWFWISRQRRAISKERENDDE